ncbi:MAG: aspartate aminotransferase family protein [Dehalococcoidia bacterium]|nr:MAG: aspartate aminotransferase family protein [Dehalococcoidia bacterium]
MTNWQQLEHKYYMSTFRRIPITLVSGQGNRVWDEGGREYLDFTAGWAVNSLGHCHPLVVEAITQQAETLIHVSNSYYTIPQIKLAELLVQNSSLEKVFFCNSGTEATEGAVKLARRYGHLHLNGAYEVITATGSFHGRTLAMVSASGQPEFQKPYTPLPTGFVNIEYNNVRVLEEAINTKTCAVMLEPIQGEGGVNLPDAGYLKAVSELCQQKGIPLILDEIQTGIGRTGRLFAYEHYDLEPDIMTLAKGLASGIPIGAVLAKNKVSVFITGEHGSTFGGNPLASAAGYATLKFIIDNNIINNARLRGQQLTLGLKALKQKYNIITDVRGMGLLQAMDFNDNIAQSVMMACLENGLLVNELKKNALRFMPSLIVTENEINEALEVLDKALVGIQVKK